MGRDRHAVGGWLFAFVLSAYVATSGGSMATDSMSYEVARNIVEEGSVAMSYQVLGLEAHRGIDGRYYAPYGIGHALWNVPFYIVGRTLEQWTGFDVRKPEAMRKAVVVLGSAVAAALAVWVTFLFARAVGGSSRAAAKTALTLGFATLLWPYAKFGFNAPLATLCLLVGTYAGWRAASGGGVGALLGAGCGIGSALLVRHELVLGALPIAAVLWMSTRDRRDLIRRGLLVAAPVAVAVVVTLVYNYVRIGNPLDTGYLRDETARPGSLWSFGQGIVGMLFSPGRSLFLYAPVTLAGVLALAESWRRQRSLAVLCGGEVLVLLLFYASLVYWDADRSHGPRYLVPALPFLVLPLVFWFRVEGSRSEAEDARAVAGSRPSSESSEPDPRACHGGRVLRWGLSALAVLSLLVQVPGVLVDFSKAGYTPEVGYRSLDERRWTWEAAGLTLNTRAALRAVPENLRYLSGAAMPPPIAPADRVSPGFSEQLAFSLDFWWLYLFYLGAISAPVAAGLGALAFAVAAMCGWQLRRTLDARGAASFTSPQRVRRATA